MHTHMHIHITHIVICNSHGIGIDGYKLMLIIIIPLIHYWIGMQFEKVRTAFERKGYTPNAYIDKR